MIPTPLPDLHEVRITLGPAGPRLARRLAIAGAVALGAGLVFGLLAGDGLRRFFHSWLVSYCFVLSLSLGAMFLVAMLHVTRAGWGVVVRRIAEILGGNVAVLAVLFAPVLVGLDSLFEWADPQAVQADALLRHKAPYLNLVFFAARALAYFALWWFLGRYFLERSTEQDATGDPGLTVRMERASGPALLVLALSVTFAAFDWLMALDARWYSTIFGVYFFSGAMVGALAAVVLAAMSLQSAGRLRSVIHVEHYHDLGKLLFAFVVFWGYIAFSQFLLIWYANIPEETIWYRQRLSDGWQWVAVVLLFGHLIIPFVGLMSREAKRRKPLLAFWSVWMAAMHWIDLYWLVMPRVEGAGSVTGILTDVCLLAGIVCLYLAGAVWTAGDRSLVPRKDPRLGESLAFENT
ncbi:MAG: quinol:cytochrome C oxidoreductase [Thermoguttaceae bacterium]|jgi:hypothetical protein|nr:quinol:cytochrome C oxidoreductase [Thermoguttaceae bacterium]